MVSHGEIGKLGEDRGRAEINVMLKRRNMPQREEERREKMTLTQLYIFCYNKVKKPSYV